PYNQFRRTLAERTLPRVKLINQYRTNQSAKTSHVHLCKMPETRLPNNPALRNEAPRRMHILWLGLCTRHDRRQEAEGRGDRSEPTLDMELEERTVGPRQARLDRRGRIVLAEKQFDPIQLSP